MSILTPGSSTTGNPVVAPGRQKPVVEKVTDNYLTHDNTFKGWALTVDHKKIAVMYLVGVLGAFLLGGVAAIALRTILLWHSTEGAIKGTGGTLLGKNLLEWYNQAFTIHGAVMVFLFIIPAIPAVIGNLVLPIMVGAKDVAFPKLNLLSLYCWVAGAAFFLYILIMPPSLGGGGLATGWTFYTPLSLTDQVGGATMAVMGAFILGFSSILTGVNFIATIHMLRPKEQGWFRLPLLLWSLYSTALIQILATPVLAITLLLVAAERTLGVGIFDPALGGDPVLYQHFFWFYSHPAVYIMILPALGVTSEIISAFSRKHIFGYKFIAFSSLAIALFGFIVWGHHMFTSGQSLILNSLFSLLSMTVAIPSAVKVFNWLATMYRGNIRLDTPMLYALGFIWLFTIGGLTGLYLAALSVDIHLHDTYFVVAHFHYVMVGSTLFAFIGGLYFWWPKLFGKMYNEKVGRWAWGLVFAGFNIAFFIQFFAGSHGMPRRYADYPEQYHIYHVVSTLGSYVLAAGLFLVLWNWIDSLRKGKQAPANPWGANTLEWQTTSPPAHENFKTTPIVTDPYTFDGWWYDEETDQYLMREDYEEVTARAAH